MKITWILIKFQLKFLSLAALHLKSSLSLILLNQPSRCALRNSSPRIFSFLLLILRGVHTILNLNWWRTVHNLLLIIDIKLSNVGWIINIAGNKRNRDVNVIFFWWRCSACIQVSKMKILLMFKMCKIFILHVIIFPFDYPFNNDFT